jgi:hypothetical protein
MGDLTKEAEALLGLARAASALKWKDADDWNHDHNVGFRICQDEYLERAACDLIAACNPEAVARLRKRLIALEQVTKDARLVTNGHNECDNKKLGLGLDLISLSLGALDKC